MLSMTGFGNGRAEGEAGIVTVQVATVNNRGCKVSMRTGLRDLAKEEAVRKLVQSTLRRGSINVRIDIERNQTESFDRAAVVAAYAELRDLAEACGAPQPSLSDALRHVGGATASDASSEEAIHALVDSALADALTACQTMRATEGAAMASAFSDMHQRLTQLSADMAERAAPRAAAHTERLCERLQEVVADRADITPEHLIRELAIYADKIDVTEEQVRLVSHLDQFAALIKQDGDIGKRIEFLVQEIGREVNTTGSKANDADLQQLVVEAKNVLDQCKEQAANVL